jgi:hypothetical protein
MYTVELLGLCCYGMPGHMSLVVFCTWWPSCTVILFIRLSVYCLHNCLFAVWHVDIMRPFPARGDTAHLAGLNLTLSMLLQGPSGVGCRGAVDQNCTSHSACSAVFTQGVPFAQCGCVACQAGNTNTHCHCPGAVRTVGNLAKFCTFPCMAPLAQFSPFGVDRFTHALYGMSVQSDSLTNVPSSQRSWSNLHVHT